MLSLIIVIISILLDGLLSNILPYTPNALSLFTPMLTIVSLILIYPLNIKKEQNKDSELPHTILDKFLTTIQGQAEEIGALKARIKDLEQRLGKTAGDVNIGATANVG